jgi:hypothetical protein
LALVDECFLRQHLQRPVSPRTLPARTSSAISSSSKSTLQPGCERKRSSGADRHRPRRVLKKWALLTHPKGTPRGRRRDAKKNLLETLRLPRTAPLSGAGVRPCASALRLFQYSSRTRLHRERRSTLAGLFPRAQPGQPGCAQRCKHNVNTEEFLSTSFSFRITRFPQVAIGEEYRSANYEIASNRVDIRLEVAFGSVKKG